MIPGLDLPFGLKKLFKKIIPHKVISLLKKLLQNFETKKHDQKYLGQSNLRIFSSIYQEGRWGRLPQGPFCSGHGSHLPLIVRPYVVAVSEYLSQFSARPDVVELGCGGFNGGSKFGTKLQVISRVTLCHF